MSVPAWKRIGLKVQEELHNDPLSLTEHLESGKVTNKQAKQLSKRKRTAQLNETTEKKPPKRVKVAKSERPPPPEKDQLVYLKNYTDDLINWKFSKQKQNWILKHIQTIEESYEIYLINYLVGLQGGSRDRLVEELKKVVGVWNLSQLEYKKKLLEPEEEPKKKEEEEELKASKELDKIIKSKKSKIVENVQENVDADYALRARKIILAITEENLFLEGIDDLKEKKIDEI